MLKVQILGSGLIPRLGILAPKTDPTPVTKDIIQLIFSSPRLRMNYYNEVTGTFHPLTKKNYLRIWDDYSIERTATGKKPAKNPQVDSNDAYTQEQVVTEIQSINKHQHRKQQPGYTKPVADETSIPQPPVSQTPDTDTIVNDMKQISDTDNKPKETVETNKQESTDNKPKETVDNKVDTTPKEENVTDDGFKTVSKDSVKNNDTQNSSNKNNNQSNKSNNKS